MKPSRGRRDRILAIDDDPDNLRIIRVLLERAGYEDVITSNDPFQAIALFDSYRPDILLVDLHMPGLNGFTLIGDLRSKVGGSGVPIVVLTGDLSRESRERALRAGATDFLSKPFDRAEFILRVRNLLQLRRLHSTLERRNESLDAQVQERTEELEEARTETLERLAIAAEYRDDQTGQHARRVGYLAAAIASAYGLSEHEVELIARGAPLHDLGKIGVPDWILLKPSGLTDHERAVMQTHTRIGAEILAQSRSEVLQAAERIALTHHERWDGRGYAGLKEDEIPIEGRIVAVADAFDAITNDRPYRAARPLEVARHEILNQSLRQFDPDIVEAFGSLEPTSLESLASIERLGASDQAIG